MPNQNKPDQPKGVQSTHNPGRQGQGQSSQSGKGESYSFRCSDVGFNDCPWEAKGSTPDEVLQQAEQHGREHHRLTNIDEQTRNKVRSNIHRAA